MDADSPTRLRNRSESLYDTQNSHQKASHSLLNAPELASKAYKQSMAIIMESFNGIDQFTFHLEKKVDFLLKTQEHEFVSSYQNHMNKIKTEYRNMEEQIELLEKKIQYYENQGEMSKLVLKLHKLEEESKLLYSIITIKDKKIKDCELTFKVLKSQNKRMEAKIKSNIREKNQAFFSEAQTKPAQLFSTQPQKLHTMPTDTNLPEYIKILNNLSISTVKNCLEPPASKSFINRSKQIERIKHRNNKLISYHSKVLGQKQELEDYFLQCVTEIKKQIKIRKKINQCTFQDFRKQDKLNLLVKVLSNEEILGYLHQRIFRKASINPESHEQPQNKFPKLNNNLCYN